MTISSWHFHRLSEQGQEGLCWAISSCLHPHHGQRPWRRDPDDGAGHPWYGGWRGGGGRGEKGEEPSTSSKPDGDRGRRQPGAREARLFNKQAIRWWHFWTFTRSGNTGNGWPTRPQHIPELSTLSLSLAGWALPALPKALCRKQSFPEERLQLATDRLDGPSYRQEVQERLWRRGGHQRFPGLDYFFISP